MLVVTFVTCLLVFAVEGRGLRSYRPFRPEEGFNNLSQMPCSTTRGSRGSCQPLSTCAAFYIDAGTADICQLPDGYPGICCPEVILRPEILVQGPMVGIAPVESVFETLTADQLEQGSIAGSSAVDEIVNFETALLQNEEDAVIKEGTPSFGHHQFFQTSSSAVDVAIEALKAIEATRQLQKQHGLTTSGFNKKN